MEKRIINDEYLKNTKKIMISCNSTLYLDENEHDLIKYLNSPEYGDSWEKREQRFNLLDRISESEFVLPKYLTYLSNFETSNLRGYGMEYIGDYIEIKNLLNNSSYSYKERLEICKKLCDIFINLEKYKISYWDIHSENILIKGTDIKVCDMDSATSKSIDGDYIYRVDLADSYRYLTSLILSILYNIDEFTLIKSLERKRSRKFVRESKMFCRVADTEGYIFYPDKYLDDFTEDYIERTKKLILLKNHY